MKKLINMLFAGKSINTSKGELTFDKDGACMLEDEVADAFKNIKGFVVENDTENNDKVDDGKSYDKTVNTAENNGNAPDGDKEDPEGGSTDENDGVNLDSLSVLSLKKYAKEQGIDITGLSTKETILKAIKEVEQK